MTFFNYKYEKHFSPKSHPRRSAATNGSVQNDAFKLTWRNELF